VGGILTDALSWRWIFFVNAPVGAFALVIGRRYLAESRDEGARHTDLPGLASFSAALLLLVLGIMRGNADGWTSAKILLLLAGGAALLVGFVAVELGQERPMLDMSLFRRRAFLGVSLATFAIAVGMFAAFPYLSIYFQDVLGYSPLGAGLRFLPLTGFVFFVPLATRRLAAQAPLWGMIGAGLTLVCAGLLLMAVRLHTGSHWTAVLPGFVVAGVGIGIANPALAAGALRVVDPARSGMASGINNTFRLCGVAMGVAVLGAVLESGIGHSLSAHGVHVHGLAAAVTSAGSAAVSQQPALVHPARAAFVTGMGDVLLLGLAVLAIGALSGATLIRTPRPEVEAVTEPA
jgi:predicted MFS family arabinose efflux permease